MTKSINLTGLVKAAAGEVDWSAPDASYNSPYLVAGMRLTPEQNAAYDEYKATHGRAKAREWLKQNYGKTGRTQTVDETAHPVSTMEPSNTTYSKPSAAPSVPSTASAPSGYYPKTQRTRVGSPRVTNQRGLYNAKPDRTSSLTTNSSTRSIPDRMNPYSMSNDELMGWVRNHASEITNKWYNDPYYYEMAKQVASIQDPWLMSDFNADPSGGYGALENRIKTTFRDAARPYADMLQGNTYDPESSGGFGSYSIGR